jgi:hypothetical protein
LGNTYPVKAIIFKNQIPDIHAPEFSLIIPLFSLEKNEDGAAATPAQRAGRRAGRRDLSSIIPAGTRALCHAHANAHGTDSASLPSVSSPSADSNFSLEAAVSAQGVTSRITTDYLVDTTNYKT